jgi:hypothetical protein
VSAIKPIPRNTRLFAEENEEIFWVDETCVPKDRAIQKLYKDFSFKRKGHLGCPPSFNRLTPAWFMSASSTPNTRFDENYDFYTLREISSGEELKVNSEAFEE